MAEGWEPPNAGSISEPVEGPVDEAAQDVEMRWDGVQRDPDVVEEGNQLGQVIDIDDDTDNGGVPMTVPEPSEGVLEPVDRGVV